MRILNWFSILQMLFLSLTFALIGVAMAQGPTGAKMSDVVQYSQSYPSLWVYLAQFYKTQEAQIFYALMLSGTLGVFAHYFHKWFSDEITGNLFDYLFRQYPKRTLASFMTYIAWVIGLVGTGVFETANGDPVGWGVILIMGLTNGYSVDSLANKGRREPWSAEQRAALTNKPEGTPQP